MRTAPPRQEEAMNARQIRPRPEFLQRNDLEFADNMVTKLLSHEVGTGGVTRMRARGSRMMQ